MDRLNKILDEVLNAVNESTNMTIADGDGRILYANEGFCRLSKYEEKEIIGQSYQILYSYSDSKAFFKEIIDTLKSGHIWRGELQHIAKDGSVFWTFTTIAPTVDDNGQLKHTICFHTDITEKKQIEKTFKTQFIRSFQNGIFKVRKEKDGSLRYSMSEGKLMDKIGATAEKILFKTPYDVLEPEIAEINQRMYTKAFQGEKVQYEIEFKGRSIHVDLEPIKNNGIVTEIVGTVYDFSEFRDVQKQLKVNTERYHSLIHYSHEYIITLDKDGTILHMNPKTMELFDAYENDFGKMNILEVTVEEKKSSIADYLRKALSGEVQIFEFEVNNKKQRKILNITFVPILVDNEIDGVYAIGKDITDDKLMHEYNAYLAHHDDLTNLPNRRWMEQKIQQTLKYGKNSNQTLALLLLDLDRFKSINDTLGHFIGDELLQHIAKRLEKSIPKNNVHIARMGGDEFMIFCQNIEKEEDVMLIAQSILEHLEEPFYVQGYELLVTGSIGIVIHSSKAADVTKLMKKVDMALYKSKELGRNMYQIYDDSMNQENYQSFIMERDLRKAIMNEEFIAHLQPKVDALTGHIVGAEALIRWNHPEYGLVPPGKFIPIAEESGLIGPIGEWMMKKVCKQLAIWKKSGFSLIPVSVNITSKRFLQQGFADGIRKLLKHYGLEGKWLEIEITENSIMRNEEMVQKTLKELKEMGVKIFIDDFGTGYSSFNYLKTFRLDGVKIDQSFVRNIANNPENASITSAMIKVAQQLNLEVIAEGVETKEELDFLLSLNCRYIQGYYFGKPCPIEEFEKNYLMKENYKKVN